MAVIAKARIEVYGFTRQLLVYDCPICHRTHRHGAGAPLEPIEPYLGARETCCRKPGYFPEWYHLRVV